MQLKVQSRKLSPPCVFRYWTNTFFPPFRSDSLIRGEKHQTTHTQRKTYHHLESWKTGTNSSILLLVEHEINAAFIDFQPNFQWNNDSQPLMADTYPLDQLLPPAWPRCVDVEPQRALVVVVAVLVVIGCFGSFGMVLMVKPLLLVHMFAEGWNWAQRKLGKHCTRLLPNSVWTLKCTEETYT